MSDERFPAWRSAVETWTRQMPIGGTRYLDRMRNAHLWILESLKAGHPQAKALAKLVSDTTLDTAFAAEICWDFYGRPYYKVHRGMCECMSHCSIDIPAECVKMPFPVIEVRLPRETLPPPVASSFLVGCATRQQILDSLESRFGMGDVDPAFAKLVGRDVAIQSRQLNRESTLNRLQRDEAERGRLLFNLNIFYQTWTDIDVGALSSNCLEAHGSQTIEEAVEEWESRFPPASDDTIAPHAFRRLLRIFVATIFFAVDKHEVVSPDATLPDVPRTGQRRKALAQIQRDKLMKKCRGWNVGAEIHLPRPMSTHRALEHTGRELQFGHIRSGHMRMQPHGPKQAKRKLLFIPPTAVRPDLPMQTSQRGYSIGE